jgi:hypothetical protein
MYVGIMRSVLHNRRFDGQFTNARRRTGARTSKSRVQLLTSITVILILIILLVICHLRASPNLVVLNDFTLCFIQVCMFVMYRSKVMVHVNIHDYNNL